MKTAIIVGMGSEIAQNIADRLYRDGWQVSGCSRQLSKIPTEQWDLLFFARGTMEPIGPFFDTDPKEWEAALRVNALSILDDLRALWPQRKKGGQIVFIDGPNMKNPSQSYSAYRCGKAILEAIIPTLNAEYYPYNKFLLLSPGVVKTKFHQQTIRAGDKAWNIDRVMKIVNGEEKTVTHDEVYYKLIELIS